KRRGGPGQTRALGNLGERPVGAAVGVVRYDDVVAGMADGTQEGVLRGEPRGKRQAALTALESGQAVLECLSRGVGRAAVLVALAWSADGVLPIGGRGKYVRYDRPGDRFGILAGVDGERFKAVGHSAQATGRAPLGIESRACRANCPAMRRLPARGQVPVRALGPGARVLAGVTAGALPRPRRDRARRFKRWRGHE